MRVEERVISEFTGKNRTVPWHEKIDADPAEVDVLYVADGIPLLHVCELRDTPRNRFTCDAVFDRTLEISRRESFEVARSGSQKYVQRGGLIGLLPQNVTMKKMGVRPSRLELDHPDYAGDVIRLMEMIWEQVAEDCPEIHADMMECPRVPAEWSLGSTPFTSAQVNLTASLPYHRDRGNLKFSPCSMLIMQRNTEGGYLHIPQFNLLLESRDGLIVTFYQDFLWHGVTPIMPNPHPKSARISVVGYVNNSVFKQLTEIGAGDLNRAAMRTGTRIGQIIRAEAVPESMRRALMGTPVRFEGDRISDEGSD